MLKQNWCLEAWSLLICFETDFESMPQPLRCQNSAIPKHFHDVQHVHCKLVDYLSVQFKATQAWIV